MSRRATIGAYQALQEIQGDAETLAYELDRAQLFDQTVTREHLAKWARLACWVEEALDGALSAFGDVLDGPIQQLPEHQP